MLPRALVKASLGSLERAARVLVRMGVTANSVTVLCAGLAALSGVLLGVGRFGPAAVAMGVAALGDAIDGRVARRSGSASVGGALLDASVDRYGEFFALAGLAVYFRASVPVLLTALLALAGSFMVSYGSAKAEGLGVPAPPGAMRRAERAVCLWAGVALLVPCAWLAREAALPAWVAKVPVLGALGVLAVGANFSAIRRLRKLARLTDGPAGRRADAPTSRPGGPASDPVPADSPAPRDPRALSS
jgi:CDP-diacylglycerol--glycerol-3-phosphate 3-phosphatidyltransferase